MITPYNTGKVLIGCNYQAPIRPWFPSRTETMLQASMLQTQKPKQAKPTHQIDWDGITIVMVCGVITALAIVGVWMGAA